MLLKDSGTPLPIGARYGTPFRWLDAFADEAGEALPVPFDSARFVVRRYQGADAVLDLRSDTPHVAAGDVEVQTITIEGSEIEVYAPAELMTMTPGRYEYDLAVWTAPDEASAISWHHGPFTVSSSAE